MNLNDLVQTIFGLGLILIVTSLSITVSIILIRMALDE